ncbi:unnamed protein product [Cuscuta epithymum]|uniref:NAC domain-containing protein n=1 Tax=Cuscuta epithymum TaxID=186058 RepID=A0AAV0DRN2_9ASTE|nr:unnamed protein product [Cuscuta epithymum]
MEVPSPNNQPSLSTTAANVAGSGGIHPTAAADPFNLPPGYCFRPTDKELILEYLKKKILDKELPPNRIVEVELYKHTPEQLSANNAMVGENEWYFFTSREKKYPNGSRPKRAAGSAEPGSTNGYWKATGKDRTIQDGGKTIGFKKCLVFYEGKPSNGKKTSWLMHEYRVDAPKSTNAGGNYPRMMLDKWVLCKIYKKTLSGKKDANKEEDSGANSTDELIQSFQPLSYYHDDMDYFRNSFQ